jgi:hypothetical protein
MKTRLFSIQNKEFLLSTSYLHDTTTTTTTTVVVVVATVVV